MKLQERDFSVLGALERWGIMGMGQVDGLLFRKEVSGEERTRLFFNEIRREDYWGRAYKRLRGLEKLGLIQVRRYPYSWPVYRLSHRGFELLKRRGKTRFETPNQGVSDRLVRHEIATVGVGLILTQTLGLGVLSARETWDWMGQGDHRRTREARLNMPDFLVGKPGGVGRHIVEVELTPKSKKRYAEIFRSHRRMLPDQDGRVLYLVDWPGGVSHIMRLGYKYEVSCVQAAQLSEFKAKLGRCAFAQSYGYRSAPFDLGADETVTQEPQAEAAEAGRA